MLESSETDVQRIWIYTYRSDVTFVVGEVNILICMKEELTQEKETFDFTSSYIELKTQNE